jgi:oligopeptide/dipeptide ABC transporter ATP-binding protein
MAATEPAVMRPVHGEPLIEVEDLYTRFGLRGTFTDRLRGRDIGSVKAVDGVSFNVHRGEVLGVVGESGSGKTTLARTLLGLVDATDGSIRFEGQELTGLSESGFRPFRRRLQVVFQDPHASLNPAMTIGQSVGDPLRIHGLAGSRDETVGAVTSVLERVGLQPADQFMDKYPGDLSGGQKQRAVLARAIILRPDVLIADEPVSMLDMSVRAKILELMLDLKRELDLTYVYITHDLATARFFCDRIAIMYLGRIVELGPADEIYADPKHPYTVSLLEAIPEPDPTRSVPRNVPRGEIPDAVAPPLGCAFHPRCRRAFEVCGWEARDLRTLLEARWTRLPEPEYEAEREIIGDLASLDDPGPVARLPAAGVHDGAAVAQIVQRMRDEEPDDPFWKGVAATRVERDAVVLEFHPGLVPGETPAGQAIVRCHLFDDRAMALAKSEATSAPG